MPVRLHIAVIQAASVLIAAASCVATAQLPQIRLEAVFPAGAQRGTTTELKVTAGQDMDEADSLVSSHPGIRAVQKRAADGTAIQNTFIVSVDSVVPCGLYDLRIAGLFGISNPVRFRIDELSERTESEPNDRTPEANPVLPESVLNGRSDRAGDVDCFRLTCSNSGTIVLRAEAAVLGSRMQPIMEVFDEHGSQLAVSRRVLSQDAAIVRHVNAGDVLTIRLRDTVYAGGFEYFYRLVIDSRPFAEMAVPHPGDWNEHGTIELFGRHLPGGQPTPFQIDGMPLLRTSNGVAPTGRPAVVIR
jgi:hypothetical protein